MYIHYSTLLTMVSKMLENRSVLKFPRMESAKNAKGIIKKNVTPFQTLIIPAACVTLNFQTSVKYVCMTHIIIPSNKFTVDNTAIMYTNTSRNY